MSNPINQNSNTYKYPQAPMGMNSSAPDGNSSAMGLNPPQFQLAPETVKQNVNANPLVKSAKEDNPLVIMGLLLPTWFGIAKGMDKFNAACRTMPGKENLIDRVRNFGDKVENKITSKNPEGARKFGAWINNAIQTIDNKIIKKVSILNSVIHNPSKPEFEMIATVHKGTLGELGMDAPQAFTRFVEEIPAEKLKRIQALGFKDGIEFELLKDKLTESDIIKRCRNACKVLGEDPPIEFSKKAAKVSFWNYIPSKIRQGLTHVMGEKNYTKTFGRKMYLSELANKLEALQGLKSAKNATATGKILSKSFLRTMEGLTNGTAGGKLAIAMQAYCFAAAIAKTWDAPKGEKLETFMENIVYDLAFYLTMPLGLSLMHGAGGLQYIGMTTEQVAKYREKLAEFNEKAKAGLFTKEQYKAERNALVDMFKGETKLSLAKDGAAKTGIKAIKNIVHKPLRAFGRMITVGLETVRPYVAKDATNFLAKSWNNIKTGSFWTKKGLGFPVRFLGFMMLIAPPLAAAAVKIPHAIFGRPTKSVIDDEPSEKETKTLPPLVYPSEQTAQTTQMLNQQSVMQPVQQNNLANNSMGTMDSMSTNVQKQRTMIPTESTRPTGRRYIPSSDGVKITAIDPGEAKARKVLAESQKSEKIANKRIDK